MQFDFSTIDKSWTLFLDRDGVLNDEKKDSYVFNRDELKIYDYVPKAVGYLSTVFNKIILATNQKGIGKGLMSVADLSDIHDFLKENLAKENGKLDAIYFAPDLDSNSPNRKPQAGMAFQAKKDFPEIDFSKSIMVGNRISDMEFGRNAGMHTVFVATTHPETPFPNENIDYRFDNLEAFASYLKNTLS
ncbi:MAG: phosphatase [Pseudopedobacter saltans]|uniref:D,D-heptose 1,7-bisphosphate phosphatase n=1 Tax=Pseudopedobacter saltans TaxID=151895 RepID=A0A2W5FCI4_9SPHI|nr:MAG: phosphatase [Pseudopedobacter saltans]